jgi:hypothetical protein
MHRHAQQQPERIARDVGGLQVWTGCIAKSGPVMGDKVERSMNGNKRRVRRSSTSVTRLPATRARCGWETPPRCLRRAGPLWATRYINSTNESDSRFSINALHSCAVGERSSPRGWGWGWGWPPPLDAAQAPYVSIYFGLGALTVGSVNSIARAPPADHRGQTMKMLTMAT